MDGKIVREGNDIIITVVNEPYSVDYGATCLNPGAPEDKREYQKVFTRRKLYLPSEISAFQSDQFAEGTFVISMNGYSSLKANWLKANAIQPGAYEAACQTLFRELYNRFKAKLPKVKLVTTYGVSDMGVDLAISNACIDLGIEPLGFTCPRFALYMADEGAPVYIAHNPDSYADSFIRNLHFLICAGGRAHALKHDVYAACVYQKRVYFVDVPSMLSEHGHVDAVVDGEDGEKIINNAASAFGDAITFFDRDEHSGTKGDIWDKLFEDATNTAYMFAKKKLPPKYAF